MVEAKAARVAEAEIVVEASTDHRVDATQLQEEEGCDVMPLKRSIVPDQEVDVHLHRQNDMIRRATSKVHPITLT